MNREEPPTDEQAAVAVDELMAASTWDELVALLHESPVLLTPEALGSVLGRAQWAGQAGAQDSVIRMQVYAVLLDRCAQLGVEEGVSAWVAQGWNDADEMTRWYERAVRGDPEVDLDGELDLVREVMWISRFEGGPLADLWDQVITLLRVLLEQWGERGGGAAARSEHSRWERRHLARSPQGTEEWAERAEASARAAAAQFQADGDREALDDAVETLRAAQEVRDDALRRSDLARLLLFRFEVGGNQSDIAASLVLAHQAAEELTDPTDRALALDREGMAAADAYSFLGRADLLEHAIACQEKAVELAPADSHWRPAHLGNLAGSLLQRNALRGDADDGRRAVELLRDEVASCPVGHELRADALANLAAVLVALVEETWSQQSPADATEAVGLLREAVALGGNPANLALWRLNLGRALGATGDHTGAVTELRTVLSLLSEDHPDRAGALLALADAEAATDQPDVDPLPHYTAAVEAGIGSRPDAAAAGAAKGAAWATAHHRDAAARDLYRRGLDVLDAVTARQVSFTDQLAWRRHASRVVDEGAVALATSGHVDEAVAHLERGRAALLRAGLRQHADDHDGAGALAVATAEVPLVLLVAGGATGIALVVNHGVSDAVPLPSFDREQLIGRITEMKSTQAARRRPGGALRWNQCLDSTARWLHESVVGPLEVACGPLGANLALGVDGLVGLLPFAAAWTPDEHGPRGRRSVVDNTALTMTSSGAALATAMQHAERQPIHSVVVAGATDTGLPDLPGTLEEAREVAEILPGCTVLTGSDAVHDKVIAALAGADILHAAVHGHADLIEPLRSGLILSGGGQLTVGDLLTLQHRTRRLAVLSACDTAVPGIDAPTEAVGLPMALSRLGVAGVVASLWPVGDNAARLLITRMLRSWIEGVPLADALADAQRWLRGLAADDAEDLVGRSFAAEHPFGAIRSWAAFTLTGA